MGDDTGSDPRSDDLIAKCLELKSSVDDLKLAINEQELLDGDTGNSLLHLKNHQLASYLLNLQLIASKKASGQSIESNPCIENLVEIRTVLEKVRPITRKLQSQFDKILQASHGESAGPSNLTPAADNLMDDEDMRSSDEDWDEKDEKRQRKYVPPKITAMHYDGETGTAEEKAKLRAKDKHLLEELRSEQSVAPMEITDAVINQKKRYVERQKKRQEYEEDHLIRLRMSKREKQADRRAKDSAFLDSILAGGERDIKKDTFGARTNSKSKGGFKRKKKGTQTKGSKRKKK